jgi:syntaxin-binding protein 1
VYELTECVNEIGTSSVNADMITALVQGPGDKDLKRRIKQRQSNEEEYELSRYKPLLRTVIEVRYNSSHSQLWPAHPWLQDQVSGKLDPAGFPYVKDYPQSTPAAASARPTMTPTTSLRSAKPSWHRAARTGGPAVETRQRLLVFVAGGMTYSEMREAYSLSSQLGKDIFIGAVAQQLILLILKAELSSFLLMAFVDRINAHADTASVY